MAAMARDHAEMHDLLQPQLNFLNKKKNYSLFADSQSLLLEIAQTIMGKIPLKDSSLTGNMLTYRKESLFELVRALGTHWTGQDVSSNTLSQLNMHFNTANENGFVWFAREAALILHKFGKKKPLQTLKDSKKLDKYPPLTELIKPVCGPFAFDASVSGPEKSQVPVS